MAQQRHNRIGTGARGSVRSENVTPDPTNLMESFFSRMESLMTASAATSVPTSVPAAQGGGEHLLRTFKSLRPPTYSGEGDPIQAENWIRDISRVFDGLKCSDNDRTTLAVYQLTDSASVWWEQMQALLGEEAASQMSWGEFKTRFFAEFFSVIEMRRKEQEFIMLQQKDMTVRDYLRKFNSLSKYAPHAIGTEDKKVWRFVQGLRLSLRKNAVLKLDASFEKCVHAVISLEVEEQNVKKEFEGRKMTQQKPPQQNHSQWKKRERNGDRSGPKSGGDKGNSDKPMLRCYNCGKTGHLKNDCRVPKGSYDGKCYVCGEPGHVKRNCPKLSNNQGQPIAKRGKINAVVEVAEDPEGTFTLNLSHAIVLLDTGASHSFVSSTAARRLSLEMGVRDPPLVVENPVGMKGRLDSF